MGAPLTLVGRYQLAEELGRGGMGVVWAGRDLRLERHVAVKVLHPEMAAQPGIRDRFEVEARAAASLVHPHVVAVFDSGDEAGIPFLVMERLPGRTLADAIDEGPMDPGAVRELGLQVLDALAAAHASGLIHRDIKPANVLAAGPGNWKVADFGIAKSVDMTAPGLTSTGLIVGTPAYLPPERIAGAAATPSGDLYAVGVVLYEALVGRQARGRSSPASLSWQPLPAVDQIRPGLPPDLVAVVNRATMPDPAARFSSAPQMAAWLEGQGIPAAVAGTRVFVPPRGATEAFVSPPAATEVLRVGPHEPLARRVSRSLRNPRILIAALAAGVVLVAVILAISLTGQRGAPPVTPTTAVTTPTSVTAPSAAPTTNAQSSGGSQGGKARGKKGK